MSSERFSTRFLFAAAHRNATALLLSLAVAMSGCEKVAYVLQAAEGQLSIQGDLEPIDDVLASGRLSEDEQSKLELIVAARDFAADTMGLSVGDSYSRFYDTAGDPLAFNLSASRRDALEPLTWRFPVIGTVPYLGFFDEQAAMEYEERLEERGYDTFRYEVDAYSTLGIFEDPVRSTMLRRGVISLSDTIIHEIAHNTVYRPSDTVFNESIATFIGRQGSIEFLRAHFGEESGWPELAADYNADVDVINVFLMQLYAELQAFYAQPISSEEKISRREQIYQAARERFTSDILPTLRLPEVFDGYAFLPTNNAWMLGNYRYNLNLDVFAEVYESTGRDWRATIELFRQAARAEGDPVEFLRSHLGSAP